jgi:glycosyltransferase involved in cell wall biosynthesis
MPNRIRVLCVVDNLEIGGVREVVLSQISGLDTDRFEVGLLTLADDLEHVRDRLPSSVAGLAATYRVDYRYGVLAYLADGFLFWGARRFGRDALSEIERYDPDVLHFHTNPRDLGLGILAGRRGSCALVFTDHLVRIRPDDYSRHARFLLRVSYRRLYRRFHVISVGPSVARANGEAGFLDPSRKHLVLENEVDLERFRPPGAADSDRALEVIYVGRINHVKGIDTLIRAFGRLGVDQPVRLVLVGPDSTDGAMRRLAEECVDPPLAVEFLGPRTDVPELLRRAAIGVLPSRREGQPLALQEQMATGLAVVASGIAENADLVSDGVNGLLFPVDDADALASALRMLLEDADLRGRLGGAAREFVESHAGDPTLELARFYEAVTKPAPVTA